MIGIFQAKTNYDDDDDDDDNIIDINNEENIYEDEINVFDRVGLPGDILLGLRPLSMADKISMAPLEKFKLDVRSVARQLYTMEDIYISHDQITEMIEMADKVNKVEHKNPTAYVLGFLATVLITMEEK